MGCKLSNYDTVDNVEQFNIVYELRKPILVREFKADFKQMTKQDEMHVVNQGDQISIPALSSISICNSKQDVISQHKTLKLIVNQIQQAHRNDKRQAYGKNKSQKSNRVTMEDLEEQF